MQADMTTNPFLQQCEEAFHADGLFGVLRALNATTAYRFTGIYRFEGEWVRSVWLYDRTRPDVRFGSDVRWDASYCRITATDGGTCEIENSLADTRLRDHTAREVVQSYLAIVLRMPDFTAFGTLCHYDTEPRVAPRRALEGLRTATPLIERALRAEVARARQGQGRLDPVPASDGVHGSWSR